jgi:hypothetical protein
MQNVLKGKGATDKKKTETETSLVCGLLHNFFEIFISISEAFPRAEFHFSSQNAIFREFSTGKMKARTFHNGSEGKKSRWDFFRR